MSKPGLVISSPGLVMSNPGLVTSKEGLLMSKAGLKMSALADRSKLPSAKKYRYIELSLFFKHKLLKYEVAYTYLIEEAWLHQPILLCSIPNSPSD